MRYLPASEDDVRQMLGAIGVKSMEDLLASIPKKSGSRGRWICPRPCPNRS